jgi:enamine deaminase RidA (YjgF/YER057c/UK114 family)
MKKTSRRGFITKGAAAGAVAAATAAPAAAQASPERKIHYRDGKKPDNPPLFSSAVSYGNLLFISGKGYHQEGDIKKHTDEVLKTIQEELERCGSSMNKCLKCNVYLNDLADYDAMNSVFRGRFGDTPPVRTTIAAAGGIPGNSLVEIDVIAFI